MAARTVLTYADYAAMPEDGRRYELRDGELSVMPVPGTRHQLTRSSGRSRYPEFTAGKIGVPSRPLSRSAQ